MLKKYGMFVLIFMLAITYAVNIFAETEMVHDEDNASILGRAPLAVSCTEEEAVLKNVISLDNSRFVPDCVKVSLSDNPVIECTTFDFVRHDVVILKDGVDFGDRAVSYDMTSAEREKLAPTWSYNFETGEFLPRRNSEEPSFSTLNTGEGAYNIWCRYHFLSGMTMRLWVVP